MTTKHEPGQPCGFAHLTKFWGLFEAEGYHAFVESPASRSGALSARTNKGMR